MAVTWSRTFLSLDQRGRIEVETPEPGRREVSDSEQKPQARQPVIRGSVEQAKKQQQAAIHISQGQLKEAAAIYRELLTAGERNHIILGNLAAIYGLEGKIHEMIITLRDALELKPDFAEGHYNLANALQDQGDIDTAITCYEKALELKPDYPEALNNLGAALKGRGALQAAILCYERALVVSPNYPEALINLGAALQEQGDISSAIDYHQKALALRPHHPEAHYNLGVAFKALGDNTAAVGCYARAIELNPSFAEPYNNLGVTLKDQGDLAAAIAAYSKAIELKANYPEAHYNLGNALKEQGDINAAFESFHKAIKLKPNYPDAHYDLGNVLKEQGDINAAHECFSQAIKLRPNYPDAHNNLGIALLEQGNIHAAIIAYRNALELRPDFPEALNNLGIALKDKGDLTAANTAYHRALELDPNFSEVHNNLGNLLQEQGDLPAAIAAYHRAIELKPNYPEAHNNLGNALQDQGDGDAAIASYHRALELNPNFAEAHWNCALTMLMRGEYKDGWEKYDWRALKKTDASKPHAQPTCSQWEGAAKCDNTQLLLVSEQGLGDTLQFMRYVHALRREGFAVSLCAQPQLHSLIQASGIDPRPLTPEQANLVSDGVWMPLLSVPRHLDVHPGNPVISEPYIHTSQQQFSKWQSILATEQRPIIGINWQGNPKAEKTWLRGRSLPLETFMPIAAGNQASILSLQKGFGSEQLETCSFRDRFVSCQERVNETWDFLETAAIIANCDLVITSDTSVAHLAGGMGKTTWLLLTQMPEWRWGLEGTTSFWYPCMRLFRQTEPGNWDTVMERVAGALQSHF
jgi:tetratricopeptide (TPR) repeat protein